jgi:hypothetical protein
LTARTISGWLARAWAAPTAHTAAWGAFKLVVEYPTGVDGQFAAGDARCVEELCQQRRQPGDCLLNIAQQADLQAPLVAVLWHQAGTSSTLTYRQSHMSQLYAHHGQHRQVPRSIAAALFGQTSTSKGVLIRLLRHSQLLTYTAAADVCCLDAAVTAPPRRRLWRLHPRPLAARRATLARQALWSTQAM